ncbi:uncharacterized protein BJX67DRAFT_219001 [Aspergillus lucknowensis]|uniref:Uncharacterized protein n=1 Tax=Aspergillus lucknowensis TaxID=176173 RepID=A0ABR4M3Q6_9EURO
MQANMLAFLALLLTPRAVLGDGKIFPRHRVVWTHLILSTDATQTESPNFTLVAPTEHATLQAAGGITLRWECGDLTEPLTLEMGYTTNGNFAPQVTVNPAASLSSTVVPADIITSVAPSQTAEVAFVFNYRGGQYNGGEETQLARLDAVSLVGPTDTSEDDSEWSISSEAKVGIGVGVGMGMTLFIVAVVLLCLRRRRKRRKARKEKAEEEGGEKSAEDLPPTSSDPAQPAEVEATEAPKAELGAEGEQIELDAGNQKVELDAGSKPGAFEKVEEKPEQRYELAG